MRFSSLALSGLALAAVFGLGAGACDEEEPQEVEPATHAVYDDPLATQLVPFPSDRYTVADASTRTGRRVVISSETTGDISIGGFPLVQQRLAEMDGFSTAGGFAVSFDRPIDASSFAGSQGALTLDQVDPTLFTGADTQLVLIDVDPESPERGKVFGLLPRYYGQAKDDYYPIDEFTIVARPDQPLEPARRYLFAATTRIVDADGLAIGPSEETKALLSGQARDEYEEAVLDGLDVLEDTLGIGRSEIAVVSVFTTASMRDEMVALAERARASDPPAVVEPWEVEQTSRGDDRVRFRATFETDEYRRKNGDGTWELGADGAPISQEVVPIEAFLVFSDSTQSGPRPVVIYQHGLGGDKDGCWGTAERLAELGVAVIAIDSPEHGSRGGAEGVLQSALAFFGIDDSDGSFDIARARDNFRQMASDQLELVRLVGSLETLDLLPVGAPDGVPDLDVSQLLYIGHSFGSVQGPTIFAMAPEIRHAVWNVGGDNLMMLLADSGVFSLMVNSMKPPGTADGTLARFLSATQAIVDPGDPVNYGRLALHEAFPGTELTEGRSLLLQEVVGDNIVPNTSSDAIARAVGMSVMNPVLPPKGMTVVKGPTKENGPRGSTAVMVQYAEMNGGEPANHGELIFAPEARAQYVEFFRSALEDGSATVVEP